MMSGTTLPSSARAASIRARLASRRKLARLPSLEARAESRPQPLKLAWVKSSGQNKRRSRRFNQRLARADLPTPLGPARSMTLQGGRLVQQAEGALAGRGLQPGVSREFA